jgi:uncharacterized membrane protein
LKSESEKRASEVALLTGKLISQHAAVKVRRALILTILVLIVTGLFLVAGVIRVGGSRELVQAAKVGFVDTWQFEIAVAGLVLAGLTVPWSRVLAWLRSASGA